MRNPAQLAPCARLDRCAPQSALERKSQVPRVAHRGPALLPEHKRAVERWRHPRRYAAFVLPESPQRIPRSTCANRAVAGALVKRALGCWVPEIASNAAMLGRFRERHNIRAPMACCIRLT